MFMLLLGDRGIDRNWQRKCVKHKVLVFRLILYAPSKSYIFTCNKTLACPHCRKSEDSLLVVGEAHADAAWNAGIIMISHTNTISWYKRHLLVFFTTTVLSTCKEGLQREFAWRRIVISSFALLLWTNSIQPKFGGVFEPNYVGKECIVSNITDVW